VISENNASALHWIRKGKEFMYKWAMYDVVKITKQNSKTLIYCLNDEKEKQLLDNYAVKQKLKKELEKRDKRFFQFTFFPTNSKLKNNLVSWECNFKLVNQQFESNVLSIPSPPPKS
jgi:hypothetical protein